MNKLFQTITCRPPASSSKVLSFEVANGMVDAPKNTQKLIIRDLKLEMLIGVLEAEKQKAQRVILNLDVYVGANKKWREDDVNHVVSYADVIADIETIAKQGHIELVETFGELIAEKLFENADILGAEISIEKPEIMAQTKSVGIQITRFKA